MTRGAVIGGAILVTAAVLAAWPETTEEAGPAGSPPAAVRVAEVTATAAAGELRLPGVTRAAERARVSFVVPGRLAARPVEVGDPISAGDVVARLDDREHRIAERAAAASLAETDVRLAQAGRDLARVERLGDARAATLEEVEQDRAVVESLEAARAAAAARLAESERRLAESVLRAPFAGTVTAVLLEPGEWAGPGQPVVELAGSGDVEVVVEAPESVVGRLRSGLAVLVELPFAGRSVAGRVTAVGAAASGPGRLFTVEVTLDGGAEAVAGLAAEVVLPLEPEKALSVPLAAVLDPGSSRPAVFRVVDGRAERVPVRLGRVHRDRVTVAPGALGAGDRVAVAGHTTLAAGDPVEVVP